MVFLYELKKTLFAPVVTGCAALSLMINFLFVSFARPNLNLADAVARLLFRQAARMILFECCVLALFAALLSACYERERRTEHTVYATRTGRYILLWKLASSIAAAMICYTVITGLTYGLLLARFDLSAIWGVMYAPRLNLTIAGYMDAMVIAGACLVLTFSLTGFAFAALARGGYASAVSALLFLGVEYILEPFLASPMMERVSVSPWSRAAATFMPMRLWALSPEWFLRGGDGIAGSRFGTVGLAVSLAALALAGFAAFMYFRRRDVP